MLWCINAPLTYAHPPGPRGMGALHASWLLHHSVLAAGLLTAQPGAPRARTALTGALLPAGIACIALAFVDENDSPLLLAPGDRPGFLRPPPSTDLLQDSDFESLTAVSQHHVEPGMLQPGGGHATGAGARPSHPRGCLVPMPKL